MVGGFVVGAAKAEKALPWRCVGLALLCFRFETDFKRNALLLLCFS